MSERETYPDGVPCWVDTLQADPALAVAFYAGIFGWEFTEPGEMPDGGQYRVARINDADVAAVGSAQSGAPPAWNTYVRVDSADEAAAAVREAGGEVIAGPFDAPPAGRAAVVADPAGAAICLWEAGIREGAERVNEPSAWAISSLTTPDSEGAKAFYRAVFGWETEQFGSGPDAVSVWRRPGYVGGEPEQPVPRDVVGAMMPATEDAPAGWSVDFWVGDVDATAAKAVELGGAVAAGPFDTPISRVAVLADPAGATFSVSKVHAR